MITAIPIYYVGVFDTKALADGEIRELRYPEEERNIFSTKERARGHVYSCLSLWERDGAVIEKVKQEQDDPNECWFVTKGEDEWHIVIECTYLK